MTKPQDINVKQMKREAKRKYKEKTGHDLPDHVMENLDVLGAVGPSVADLERAIESERRRHEDRLTSQQTAVLVVVLVFLFGGGGYAAGVSLASNFGVAVVALVTGMFGFTVAALFT